MTLQPYEIHNLRLYIENNEVVFQAVGELVEVANAAEEANKAALLSYFDNATSVEFFTKGHSFIKDEFADLDGWATDDDVLFLLQNIGVLICVPKQHAIENKLIVA